MAPSATQSGETATASPEAATLDPRPEDQLPQDDDNNMSATRSAADAVFRTFELAEMIIEQLPPYQIIRAQKISPTARNVVKKSKKIPQDLLYAFVPYHSELTGVFPASFQKSKSRIDFLHLHHNGRKQHYFGCVGVTRQADQLQLRFVYLTKKEYETQRGDWDSLHSGSRTLIKPTADEDALWKKMKWLRPGSMQALKQGAQGLSGETLRRWEALPPKSDPCF